MWSSKKNRLLIISFCNFFLFSVLIVRFFFLQILNGDKWQKEASAQHETVFKEQFKRGTFYSSSCVKKDGNSSVSALAIDITHFHLHIDPRSIRDNCKDEVCKKLCYITGVQYTDDIRNEFDKPSRSRRVFRWLTVHDKESIVSWWSSYSKLNKLPFNSIFFVTDYKRSYPFGKLLGQLLHTIREAKDEITNQAYPTGGLELYFNEILSGCYGERKILRSPLNKIDTNIVISHPVDGCDVHLTIDHCIQAIVEEELERGVINAEAKGGWAVLMDPFNGEVLAIAQYPFFDPSKYKDFFNNKEKAENIRVKAISDIFEVGSIMKGITIAMALKANKELVSMGKKVIFDPDAPMNVTRTIFPGRANYPLRDISIHKFINMNMAIHKSSNIYMAILMDKIIEQLGVDWYRENLKETFGLGLKTGIEFPCDAEGFIPSAQKVYPNGSPEWSLSTPYSLAIGYNILCSSMQMVRAYAVFANGGFLVKPTFVKKIVKGSEFGHEHVLFSNEGMVSYKRVLDKDVTDAVFAALKFTNQELGTGWRAALGRYTSAGKTGTSEKIIDGKYSKKNHISSYIGFAPAKLNSSIHPRFVLSITVDEATADPKSGKMYMGGKCAAPIFREIATRVLEYLGVDADDEFGRNSGNYIASKADYDLELKELRGLYNKWNHKVK